MTVALFDLAGNLALLRLAGWLLVAEPFVTVRDPTATENAQRTLVAGVRVLGWFLLWATLTGVTIAVLHVAERL